MELSDLYSEKIIEIAANAPVCPRLEAPDATARRTSRVCGSKIEVDLDVKNGKVVRFGQDVSACALGQTSAAIMGSHIIGAALHELRVLRDEMTAMLKQGGEPPQGERWQDLKYLQPVRDFPARHTSTLLVFEAVVDCLDQIEARKAGTA